MIVFPSFLESGMARGREVLGAQRVAHALAAGADQRVGGGKDTGLGLGILLDLRHGVDDTRDKTDTDGGDTGESDRGVEEDETGHSDGELVQGTDHGVGGGRGDAHAPSGGVGNEDGGETGEDHGDHDAVTVGLGEVAGQVGGGPVFEQEGGDDQDGNGQKVVVEHGWDGLVSNGGRQIRYSGYVLSKSLKLVSLMRLRMPRT